jgi:hypothetical protein
VDSHPDVQVVDLDGDSLARMWLENELCIHCPLLEAEGLPGALPGECTTRPQDVEPLLRDRRSGVKLALADGKLVGYAVFGRPRLFRNAARLPFAVNEDALLVAALYAFPRAGVENLEAGLLAAVMDFAREHDYGVVQAVCRQDGAEPVGMADLFSAAGFAVSDTRNGMCVAETAVEEWFEAVESADEKTS